MDIAHKQSTELLKHIENQPEGGESSIVARLLQVSRFSVFHRLIRYNNTFRFRWERCIILRKIYFFVQFSTIEANPTAIMLEHYTGFANNALKLMMSDDSIKEHCDECRGEFNDSREAIVEFFENETNQVPEGWQTKLNE